MNRPVDDSFALGTALRIPQPEVVHAFAWGEDVIADGDETLRMRVTSFQYRCPNYVLVECSYLHDGASKTAWFELWRLQKAPEK